MRLLGKEGTAFKVLAFPDEVASKGEYLIIEDPIKRISVLVQVVEINYADIPGLIEEIIREGLADDGPCEESCFLDVQDILAVIKDVKVLECEFRGAILNGKFTRRMADLPSRSKSIIKRIPSSAVLELVRGGNETHRERVVTVGRDPQGIEVDLDLELLDGCLTLITGMKGTGKSHLAKLLVMELVRAGAPVIVLDLNSEYVGLTRELPGRIRKYSPGRNLKFSVRYLGRDTLADVLTKVLNLPEISANFFIELWGNLERSGDLTLDRILGAIVTSANNSMVREALISRFKVLRSSNLISDEESEVVTVEDIIRPGEAAIIVLRDLSPVTRRIFVEILLNKLIASLLKGSIPPMFLFAEEAHLYVRQTYWEDIITRMRHFGLFVTFITNHLDSLSSEVFRQIDNVFLFSFKNENDLEKISKISEVDAKTVKLIAKELPRGTCIAIGKVVYSMPSIIEVRDIGETALGATRYVFNDQRTQALVPL